MPKYYEISEAAAKRAKDMNSYSDYAPGSATAGYRAMVDEAYAMIRSTPLLTATPAGWRKTSMSATPLTPVCRPF